jgi:hypothetical protein
MIQLGVKFLCIMYRFNLLVAYISHPPTHLPNHPTTLVHTLMHTHTQGGGSIRNRREPCVLCRLCTYDNDILTAIQYFRCLTPMVHYLSSKNKEHRLYYTPLLFCSTFLKKNQRCLFLEFLSVYHTFQDLILHGTSTALTSHVHIMWYYYWW